jgi:23S rRNA pseudouridine2605 synthase
VAQNGGIWGLWIQERYTVGDDGDFPLVRGKNSAMTAARKKKSAPRGASSAQPGGTVIQPGPQRLQKILAAAGIGSRRQCEELIKMGRVEVDKKVVTELGFKADPFRQKICVDGVPIKLEPPVYYAVYKPDGVVCTNRDPAGRTRVIDLVPESERRLFTVGRLDLHSEGLILVTNDGALAERLTHPRYGVPKTYLVQVAGEPTREVLLKLQKGVHLAEGIARVAKIRIRRKHKKSTILEMVLNEGRNREIRRIMARVGHKVYRLKRIAVGPIRLGKMKPGEARRLTPEEVAALYKAAGLASRLNGGASKNEHKRR